MLPAPLLTPNFDLSGSIYICNSEHPLFPKIANEVLACKSGKVSESLVAEVLGYPFSLPERELDESDTMVEVGYLFFLLFLFFYFFYLFPFAIFLPRDKRKKEIFSGYAGF